MICEHLECNGKHDTSLPKAEVCPGAYERRLERHARYLRLRYANDAEYRERHNRQGAERHQDRFANDPEYRERRRQSALVYNASSAGLTRSIRGKINERRKRLAGEF